MSELTPRERVKNLLERKPVDRAHGKRLRVIMHSCGMVEELVPGLIEAGVDYKTFLYFRDRDLLKDLCHITHEWGLSSPRRFLLENASVPKAGAVSITISFFYPSDLTFRPPF